MQKTAHVREPRRRSARLRALAASVACGSLLGVAAQPALAFGATGHRIVAQIAIWQLEPAVAREVRDILGGDSLVTASTWADEVRGEERWRYLSPWHYVNLDPATGRFEGCPERGCIVDAIRDSVAILRDRDRPPEERLLSLRLLAHMVGDVHQPMHVSHAADRGGNQILVDFFGDEWNLHSVWDTGILSKRRGSWRRLARRIAETPREIDASWSEAALLRWVDESYGLAVRVVYPSLPEGTRANELPPEQRARLGRAYVDAYQPLVDAQLHKAGLRLGQLLNVVLREAGQPTG